VTDYVSRYSLDGNLFIPKKFQGFPEIKEALIAGRMQAGFMVAPMAMALRSQGVPIKIVYLGHRYGSAVVVTGRSVRAVPTSSARRSRSPAASPTST
jgi:NitT/TauT family transport system substrate-binding protein